MTDGPAATIGDIVPVNSPRPRERKAIMEHPDYAPLRSRLIHFLEVRVHERTPKQTPLSAKSGLAAGV